MQKRTLLQATAAACLLAAALPLRAQPVTARAVAHHYARLVHASYSEALASALALQKDINHFLATPSQASLQQARAAWITAREWYGQTEAFRFYGGPIDSGTGPESRINPWPVDESYIDYVQGRPEAGLINQRSTTLSKAKLAALNERGGLENISTGWHAIEFLLWGQDFNESGPGKRPFEDYIDGQAPNADRRRAYLRAVTELLIDDLRFVLAAWAPATPNYRKRFESEGLEALRKIIVGMGTLSRGELAGERLEVALSTQEQEDEQSCFSDNTHRDVVNNALGIENVWLGRFKRSNGQVLQGASLRDMVSAKDPALAERTTQQIAASVAAALAIQAPFDQEIRGGDTAPGAQRIHLTIASLSAQGKLLGEAASALGIARLNMAKP